MRQLDNPKQRAAGATVPLCVDLDGTVIRTDMICESLAEVLRRRAWEVWRVPFWLMQGKAVLKRRLAERVELDMSGLPYNAPFIEHLRKEKAAGRTIVLVTAADGLLARKVAKQLGFFDDVIASDGADNIRGARKAAVLTERFGAGGFDYAGDSSVDLPVWAAAREVVLVGASPGLARTVRNRFKGTTEFPGAPRIVSGLARLLRPHQWVKNLIVFVPLITSHQITQFSTAALGLRAFVAFCLAASGVYVLNDILDLEHDRRHERKRTRALASGDVPLGVAFVLAPLLAVLSAAVAWTLPPGFGAALAVYVLSSLAYVWFLKRSMLADVFTLAGLYTLRLIAGHEAAKVEYSVWLLAFSMFIFLSLALIKRYEELARARPLADVPVGGRGYRPDDAPLLAAFGAASGYLAVLVLALYVNSDQVRLLYRHPTLLLLICPLMLYWISRVWLVTHRGSMHDDPVVFALKDKASYAVGALALAVIWIAT